jgi:hypothetical protein
LESSVDATMDIIVEDALLHGDHLGGVYEELEDHPE